MLAIGVGKKSQSEICVETNSFKEISARCKQLGRDILLGAGGGAILGLVIGGFLTYYFWSQSQFPGVNERPGFHPLAVVQPPKVVLPFAKDHTHKLIEIMPLSIISGAFVGSLFGTLTGTIRFWRRLIHLCIEC